MEILQALEAETASAGAGRDAEGEQRGFDEKGTSAAHRINQRRAGLPAGQAQDAGSKVFLERRFDGLLAQAALIEGRAGGVNVEGGHLGGEEGVDAHVRLARIDVRALPGVGAQAIADASHLACVANDFGYEDVFSRWVEAFGKPGDVLLAITTSGTSKNVVKAARTAREKGVKVIALTGKAGSEITKLADIAVVTPGGAWADRVQELHIKVIHILIELVERELDPKNYQTGSEHA